MDLKSILKTSPSPTKVIHWQALVMHREMSKEQHFPVVEVSVKEIKNVRWDLSLSSDVMIEHSNGDDSEESCDSYKWQRNIVSTSISEIQDQYIGKTGLKGKHKICRSDIIQKLYADTDKVYIGTRGPVQGADAVKELIVRFCNPKFRVQETDWKLFINSNFSKDEIDRITHELTLPITGYVCVIPKDSSIGKSTHSARIKNIERGWCHARASSLSYGRSNAKLFMSGTKFIIIDNDLAKKIKENCSVGSIVETDGGKTMFFLDDSDIDDDDIEEEDVERKLRSAIEEVTPWLRWNEWNKFEKIVRTNTIFETNPGEFDYVYGGYWRAANGKQVRFDEIYEKSLVVDIL